MSNKTTSTVINVTGRSYAGKTELVRTAAYYLRNWQEAYAAVVDVDALTQKAAHEPLLTRNEFVEAELRRARQQKSVTAEVLKLSVDGYPLIIIDGLQDYGQARSLQNLYGENYHTLTLQADPSDPARLERAALQAEASGLLVPHGMDELELFEQRLYTSETHAARTWDMNSYRNEDGSPYLPNVSHDKHIHIAEVALRPYLLPAAA
ncbi:MAG: hypothetical protein WAS36_03035 [Candidatus Saccharimonadales bacterium]